MSRGGARPGAGRPRTSLTAIVLARTFDWQNRRHRRLLFEDDLKLPPDDPRATDLAVTQERYRVYQGSGMRGWASDLAQLFEQQAKR